MQSSDRPKNQRTLLLRNALRRFCSITTRISHYKFSLMVHVSIDLEGEVNWQATIIE